MTTRLMVLAALGGGLAGGTAAGSSAPTYPAAAMRPAVVVEVSPASAATVLAAARRAAPPGAPVTPAYGAADARTAVLRAVAHGHDAILGRGADVRAAQGEAAADHPEVAMGALR